MFFYKQCKTLVVYLEANQLPDVVDAVGARHHLEDSVLGVVLLHNIDILFGEARY